MLKLVKVNINSIKLINEPVYHAPIIEDCIVTSVGENQWEIKVFRGSKMNENNLLEDGMLVAYDKINSYYGPKGYRKIVQPQKKYFNFDKEFTFSYEDIKCDFCKYEFVEAFQDSFTCPICCEFYELSFEYLSTEQMRQICFGRKNQVVIEEVV